jgi:hypothetical protein
MSHVIGKSAFELFEFHEVKKFAADKESVKPGLSLSIVGVSKLLASVYVPVDLPIAPANNVVFDPKLKSISYPTGCINISSLFSGLFKVTGLPVVKFWGATPEVLIQPVAVAELI